MSDVITAKARDAKYQSHPEGQYLGVCVDVIALGDRVQDYPGTDPYLAPTCALVFRTGERNEETGDYIDSAREFTVSMGDKANLRKFLEQWRGKPYAKEDVEKGVPLHKLEGVPGLLTVSHKTSGKGRTYAIITACVGVPKQMAASVRTYPDYVRAEYWGEKRQAYAATASAFRGDQADDAPPPASNDERFPAALRDDDDLPF